MLPKVLSASVPNPILSRSKYPPPLYFDRNLSVLAPPVSPHNLTSPNQVVVERPIIPSPLANGNPIYALGSSPFDDSKTVSSAPHHQTMFSHDDIIINSSFSMSQDAFSEETASPKTDYAIPHRPLSPLITHKTTIGASSGEDLVPGRYVSDSPSPIEIHPNSSFPHSLSAPHSQEHFSDTITSDSFGTEMNGYPQLQDSDRYIRNGTRPHSSGVHKYSHPLLDQRRMSEPAIFGSTSQSGAYPNPTAEPSAGRYQQMQFAFHPPPQSPSSPYSSLHRGTSTSSLRELHHQHPKSAWKSEDHMHLQLNPFGSVGLDEPISPLNSTFSGGPHSPTLGLSGQQYSPIAEDPYGPSPPGTGTSTSSNTPGSRNAGSGGTGTSGSSSSSKTYSFVSLPGNAVKKRPRRRYDEIERLYQCCWPDCTKAYGTLNHLNAHVTMQKHGQKRSPNEFKELRKQWRKAKKEEEIIRTHSSHSHNGHGSRRGSLQHDRISDQDSHLYPVHRHGAHHHHHPYHSSHHSSHSSLGLSGSVSVPSLAQDGRYSSIPIEDVRYPPDSLDGMPRGHGAENAFRRGSHPDMRSHTRYHGNGNGSWHPSLTSSRVSHSQYHLSSVHNSSHLGLSGGLPTNADVSLNRLGPDSTLLTPLPGYEPPSLIQVENGLNIYGGYGDDDSRPDTGHRSLYDDGRPGTGHGSLYDDRPSTGHTSAYDDRPSTGHTSVYDDRPGTGHGSLYGDDRPGTGHRSLYDEGRPGTGHGSERGEFRRI